MKKQIDEILEDLYLIEPDFKNHEKELKKIIIKLLESKPDTKFDKKFALKLKNQLLNNNVSHEREEFSFMDMANHMKKIYLAAGSFIVLTLVLIPALYYAQKPAQIVKEKNLANRSLNVKKIASRAFGSLTAENQDKPQEVSSNFSSPEATSRTQSGGGSDTAMAAPVAFGRGGGGGGMPAIDEKAMFAPEMHTYRFVYKGDELSLTEKEMEVLMRVKGLENNSDLVSMVQNMNLGLIDLSSFQNAKLQNISIVEDRDFGYSAYIDFLEGMVSINENWLRWRQPLNDCQGDEKCFQDLRIKESDIPADQDIVAIADDFLRKYNIPMDVYGPGEVDNNWKIYYNQMENKADYFFPESISVVYPLMINGKVVYDEGGNKFGPRVNVNIREKIASSVYGLSSRQYESSMYETEIDSKRILSLAERGGWNRRYNYYTPEEGKIFDIEIGAPELIYVNMWRYNNMESKEIIVPALSFPVLSVPEGAWVYEKSIIVPLASELLKEIENYYPYPILMKGEEGVVTSEPSKETGALPVQTEIGN